MKKIILAFVIVCSCMCVSAQVYVGGSIGIYHQNHKEYDTKTTQVNILPEVGYTINDKWAIGTTVSFWQNKQKYPERVYEIKSFSISPYARYSYFRKNIFSLFVDGGPNISFQKDKSKYYEDNDYYRDNNDRTTYLGLKISPGVAVKVCDKISILAHLGALRYNHSDKEETFNFNLSNSLSFGVFYSF